MTSDGWNWKNKDKNNGGLLYESGNWGDLLKMLWVSAALFWKRHTGIPVNYFDPFAGDVSYPLGKRALFRLEQVGRGNFSFIESRFLKKGFWPSAASASALIAQGAVEVWDADAGRRENWRSAGAAVADGESGWQLLADRGADPDAIWLVDPYDFLAEWRERLPLLIERAESTSILLYLYNRSGRNPEAFANYRAFRNALEDARGDLGKRLGRIAADPFLPRSHHEMLFLPSRKDCETERLENLFADLEMATVMVNAGLAKAAVFDC